MSNEPNHSCGCGGGSHAGGMGRRTFLAAAPTMAAGAFVALGALEKMVAAADKAPQPVGAPKKPAVVKVGFIRARGAFSSCWPGHGYNFDSHCEEYVRGLQKLGKELGMNLVVGADAMLCDGQPLTRFIEAAKAEKPDALLLAPIGIWRWQRVDEILKAVGNVPTLLYSPIGGSFNTDTSGFMHRQGCYLVTSNDISHMRGGLEMVRTATILKQSVVLVFAKKGKDVTYGPLGTTLRYVPWEDYRSAYQKMKLSEPMRRIAEEYSKRAKAIRDNLTLEDLTNAAKHYYVSKQLMASAGADGLTGYCLAFTAECGTPCLAFLKLNDEGIPAGCEGDLGGMMTLMLGRHLLQLPGFMGDPFIDTVHNYYGNAHCTCATKLGGYDGPGAEFILRHHNAEGKYPAVGTQILWPVGQQITLVKFQGPKTLIFDRAKITCNYDIPPSATCVTSVGMVVEGAEDDPSKVGGFHVVQFYGDHVRKLREFCQLYGIEAKRTIEAPVAIFMG
jgi:hypothetical protein